jgi:acetyl esterase
VALERLRILLAVVVVVLGGLAPATASAGAGATSVNTPAGPVSIDRDIPYAGDTTSGRTLDVYRLAAPAEPARPAIVMVHGGGWVGGGADDMARQATLAARQGWVVFNINYRGTGTLGKSGQAWPAELDDVETAMAWVHDHAARYGAEPSRLAVLGASAGGNLVALATVDPPEWVAAVALWSAPTRLADLVPDGDGTLPACGDDRRCREFWTYPWVTEFLGCDPSSCEQTYRAASPVDQVGGRTPPTFIANSTDEIVPLAQAEDLAAAMQRADVDHHLRIVEGGDHAYEYTSEVWNEMMPFLARSLGVPVPEAIDFRAGRQLATPVLITIAIAVILLVALVAATVARRHRLSPGRTA